MKQEQDTYIKLEQKEKCQDSKMKPRDKLNLRVHIVRPRKLGGLQLKPEECL